METNKHDWRPIGIHVAYKFPLRVVQYVRCSKCGKVGFRRSTSLVVYTWAQTFKN